MADGWVTAMTSSECSAITCVDDRTANLSVRAKIGKRSLLQVAALNLGTILRKLIGAGTPRELAARSAAFLALLWASVGSILRSAHRRATLFLETSRSEFEGRRVGARAAVASCGVNPASTTSCESRAPTDPAIRPGGSSS